ncbi:putative disease resistance RPP13-like protein 1 [Humulus lupulus]|uniref:putative disease resistance RPP13-like protein 1 n=1 Tax=Humulus lupulus TaxID=3486 RepID=UPI002B4007A3|nr:putative disease resistance RPP13-like protein 1 [Humulus lupulus]
MAAEVVGGALLSALFQGIFERMDSREVLDFFRAKKLNSNMLKKLKIKLRSANAVVSYAEGMQTRNPAVKEWLDELKETIDELENLIDEIKTEILVSKWKDQHESSYVHQVLSFISTSFTAQVDPKIEGVLDRLELILSQMDVLGLKQVQNRPFRSLPSPLVEESDILGRISDKNAIVQLLISDDACFTKISVIPIVGMAGIGKTSLAQLVYNDERVKEHFNIRAWVTISDVFDVFKVTKTLFDNVSKSGILPLGYNLESEDPFDTNDFYQLQVNLKNVLANKKFFFVLDDIWNENYDKWDCLKSSFESGACGSKILATTRNDIVASKMGNVASYHLQAISSEDCWSLFVKHAFGNAEKLEQHPNLEIIGRQIIEKCNNLPLAVKSLAGLLRAELDPRKWKSMLKSDIWEFSERESNILPALWLSYHYLPAHLKRCFAYCSIFPKHFEFAKETLVLLWMAEDLLQPEKGKMIEDVGEEYFDHLLSRSLIQRSRRDTSLFLMHDLVNDLARFVLGKFCCRLEHDDLSSIGSNTIHHLSYEKNNIDSVVKFVTCAELTSLRTFLPLGSRKVGEVLIWNNSVLDELLSSAQYLRVLSLSQYPITELPNSIGNLKHLRYLNLSSTDLTLMPNEICSLFNLQTLLLLSCQYLTQLPVYVGSLINLRHLDIRGTKIKEMPEGMSSLKDLQTLTDFVLREHNASNIKDLKELNQLRGRLRITGIENIILVKDVLEANLKEKEYLNEISFVSLGSADDSRKEKEILDGLQPHKNLENLVIKGYKGTTFPNWVGHHSFSNMVTIRLDGCINCCFLPPLGQLPSLKVLFIFHFPMVRSIGDEFYSNGFPLSHPFRSLEKLVFRHMLEWQEWFSPRDNEGENFPCLRELRLEYCPKLIGSLPHKTIDFLIIKQCNKLVSH